ncbi:hypothetical protein OK074_1312 [Actinobacteria bacterium OK074]|nr:hypothetical protein OK074_1312 [Actinobacteria bacterium OK074]
MVFGPIARLLERLRSDAAGAGQPYDPGGAGVFTDAQLKALVSQNAEYTRNLIELEKARAAHRFRLVALKGGLALVAFCALLCALLVLVHLSGGLKLPWGRLLTTAASVVGTALVTLGVHARQRRRADGNATPGPNAANPPGSRAGDDQDRVEAP